MGNFRFYTAREKKSCHLRYAENGRGAHRPPTRAEEKEKNTLFLAQFLQSRPYCAKLCDGALERKEKRPLKSLKGTVCHFRM